MNSTNTNGSINNNQSSDNNTDSNNQYLDGELLWNKIKIGLKEHYGEDIYSNWFSKLNFLKYINQNEIILSAPTSFIRDWIKNQYIGSLIYLFHKYNKNIALIEILVDKKNSINNNSVTIAQQDITSINNDNISGDSNKSRSFDEIKIEQSADFDITSVLDERLTFDNFVIGSPNQLAYAAAYAIADSKAAINKSNPLFLYGGVGLGKTHLMHAIAWHVHKNNPKRRVLYISAEKFMYSFIKALRNKDIMAFKDEFRSVDLLMIDDIQFICGKESTQEEFFHTFNAIIDNNKQMVISCDRSPSDLDNIEDRIKSRLGWGLVADVHSTTYELRLGILESKIEQMNISIGRDVLEFLASKITSNVRELEGALHKVIALSTLIGKEITIDSTRDILQDLLRSSDKVVTVEDIQKKVASRYNIKISDMTSTKRNRAVAWPRQIAMYLAKNLTSKSFAEIGSYFNKKDHTTIMHAVKKVEQTIVDDKEVKDEINLIMNILKN
ncbi:MAG TPA: chromosomal replication initiator protein DnaA [Candidatus Megaira endosymbiont of Hartmannula sinica]|nr:chromosomal replication initiator protein DnaA [Candidatus Megaera endosymbiont of Hartmannula sinica]